MTKLEMAAVVIFSGAAGAAGGVVAHAVADVTFPIVRADMDTRYLSKNEALVKTTTWVNGAKVICQQYVDTQRRVSTLAC
jgi:hypothetical protein